MAKASVKARKVGDSIVLTLTKRILETTGFSEGDALTLETIQSGTLTVRKENDKVFKLQETRMELEILRAKLNVVDAEKAVAVSEYESRMPTIHPGIEDGEIFSGYMKELDFSRSKIVLKIAKKELEIFRLGGIEANGNN